MACGNLLAKASVFCSMKRSRNFRFFTVICFSEYRSRLGKIILASDESALTGLWFVGQKHFPKIPETAEWSLCETLPVFAETRRWLDAYFCGENPSLTISLAPSGTPFQRCVWKLLCEIPYGETRSYGELAKEVESLVGGKTSPRAVGCAVGRNPISLVIPCHRVLGKNSKIGGYAGGIMRKTALLQLEGRFLI